MKILLLLFCTLTLTLALPHHHYRDELQEDGENNETDGHEHGNGDHVHIHGEHFHTHEQGHEHGHGHGHGHHHQGRNWRKEWKEMRDQIDGMQETIEHIHYDLDKLPDFEEAKQMTGVEPKPYNPKKNMKKLFKSKSLVKLVDPEGNVGVKSLSRASAMMTVKAHVEPQALFWHRMVDMDTAVFWHEGSPVKVHMYDSDGLKSTATLGNTLEDTDMVFSLHIPENMFFLTEVMGDEKSYSVISYVVAPGYQREQHIMLPTEEIDGSWLEPTEAVIQNLAN